MVVSDKAIIVNPADLLAVHDRQAQPMP